MGCKQVSSKKKSVFGDQTIKATTHDLLSSNKNADSNKQSQNILINEKFSINENKDSSKLAQIQNPIESTLPKIIFDEENKILQEINKSKNQFHKINPSISTILNKSKPESSKVDIELDHSLNIHKTEPAPSLINILVSYRQTQIFKNIYPENIFIEELIKDIQLHIPEYSKIKNYNYVCHSHSHNILLEQKSKFTLIENLNKIPHQFNNQYKRHKNKLKNNVVNPTVPTELKIEILIEGLDDLPLNATSYYSKNKLLAKPLSNPFEIAIYEIRSGNLLFKKISNLILEYQAKDLIYFSDFSSYCNGSINKLYISGGEKIIDEVKSSQNSNDSQLNVCSSFYEINLNDLSSFTYRNLNNPRKLHSMIYIPNSYVFIVGGQTQAKVKINTIKSVEVYDISRKDIIIHSELNEERIEPALCFIDDCYLYAFSGYAYKKYYNPGSTNNTDKLFSISFERINLRSNIKTWEILYPKLSPDIKFFTQIFFSVSHYVDNKVIFLGGSQINPINNPNHIFAYSGIENKYQQINFSFSYDYKNNLIETSAYPHYNYEFSEKSFHPLITKNKNLLIPIFDRESIEILEFSALEGIRSIEFESEEKIQKMIEELNHENYIDQVVLTEHVNNYVQNDALITMEELGSYRFNPCKDRDREKINIFNESNLSEKKNKSFKFVSKELESIREENKTEFHNEHHQINFLVENKNIEGRRESVREIVESKIMVLVTFKDEEKIQKNQIELIDSKELKDLDICPLENEAKVEAKDINISQNQSSFHSLYLSEPTKKINISQKNIPIDLIMTCPKSEKSFQLETNEKINLQYPIIRVKNKSTVEVPYYDNEQILVIDSLIYQNNNFNFEYQNKATEEEKMTDTFE